MKVRSLLIGLLMVLSAPMSGCGGGSYSQGQPSGSQFPADVSGTYTFTLTGTGGLLTLQGTLKETGGAPCKSNLLFNRATHQKKNNCKFFFFFFSSYAVSATRQLFFSP